MLGLPVFPAQLIITSGLCFCIASRISSSFVISAEVISEFMVHWRNNEDLSLESKVGQRVAIELEELLWTYVYVNDSRQGFIVNHILESLSEENDKDYDMNKSSKGGLDQYLVDTSDGWHR